MTETQGPDSGPTERPRLVDVAVWLVLGGAVLLIFGGLMSITLNFDTVRSMADESLSDEAINNYLTLHRGAGVFCMVAGLSLAFVASKTRTRDERYRRSTVALSLAGVVLVAVLSLLVGTNIVALLAMLPLIVAAMLLRRPAATGWFEPAVTRTEDSDD
ncbi:hypothetical protein [[Mycobacterium] wendilense]|uniref:Uncharacterized protein n=1 Tax=[Mycobacterium] wendilense TaxID=3064284 RepID=A0ABM9MHW4_9MYCO|nr:hypothetical protein [Mycolicibacterium sp. MU0050]CAJ1585601.1 hypothetical protein MU0050_003806 [Mycolicibacterium sp. MU0050]